MPNIKKAEYDALKDEIQRLQLNLSTEIAYSTFLKKVYKDEIKESEKWKRYYDAVRETFKVEETVEIPGCFSPMDTVKYIVKKQETECQICFDEEGSYNCIRPSHEAYRAARR